MTAANALPSTGDRRRLCDVLREAWAPGAPAPFTPGDVTAGTEDELQVAVIGEPHAVDLPSFIRESAFYRNSRRRSDSGIGSDSISASLDRYLEQNDERVWENSWVRIPLARLNRRALAQLESDLSVRANGRSRRRADAGEFLPPGPDGASSGMLRVPVSSLLRLALAQALGDGTWPPALLRAGEDALAHLANDNTSPETSSLMVLASSGSEDLGAAVASEGARRFLLTQLLVAYAGRAMGVADLGQEVAVYFSPHPPVRQRQLNDCISDAFYRELFMNPCLGGWADGEAKREYMSLCHQVLSRSQLTAMGKLRDAGILANDLVLMPNISNVSLANNGTHVSLGSRSLGALAASGRLGAPDEKVLSDFVVKVAEHFLPLFVGVLSASPGRLDFTDFHPERALGFLPHQLDYTHLRMAWSAWKEKARLKVAGRTLTPLGPRALDRFLQRVLRLKGDLVRDARLLDYLVALLSTEQAAGLDGRVGNDRRLKQELSSLGVFDARMSLYLPVRPRAFAQAGYVGLEGRFHSLFASLEDDLARAVTLQAIVSALAVQYAARGAFDHGDIPDTPFVESERRQLLFGPAIGLPAFQVRSRTENRFLRRILTEVQGVTPSRRHTGYLDVRFEAFARGLLRVIRIDGAGLVEQFGAAGLLDDLEERLAPGSGRTCADRLTRGILDGAGESSPFRLSAREFGLATERYYRDGLRAAHVREGMAALEAALGRAAREGALPRELGDTVPTARDLATRFSSGSASASDLRDLILLTLASVDADRRRLADTHLSVHDASPTIPHPPTAAAPVRRARDRRDPERAAVRGPDRQLPLFHGP